MTNDLLVSEEKFKFLCDNLYRQFHSRTEVERRKTGVDLGITLNMETRDRTLWLTFAKNKKSHSVTVPIPYIENNVALISSNDVKRAICSHYIRADERMVDYSTAMYLVICDNPSGIVPSQFAKSTSFIQRIINSARYDNTAIICYSLQRAINEVVNKMPLHETDLNSWVMNHRLLIIDPIFDELQDPAKQLAYQVEKNKTYFNKGWTSIGLSDGSLATKNYILTEDIRKLTPFGLRYHNPGRNLFSTLGTKGDEYPLVKSKSMQDLMDKGVTRKGWNLFTLFADTPEVFEDQILVDTSHLNKFTTYERRIQCFGQIFVKEGDKLIKGHKLSEAPDGGIKYFDTIADNAKVLAINEAVTNVGGVKEKVYNITIKYIRKFKDGTKFTNLHGNKGVIRFEELGNAIDPRTGELRKLDVISACTSVKKRKNFGQLLEAICNNITDEKGIVLEDDYFCSMEMLEKSLVEKGFPKDAAWVCNTYAGELTGICGVVFWGVISQPEGALWDKGTTTKKNGRELRTAGLKFSTVEFRAIQTRFGNDNPIIDEIMSYAQGTEDLHDKLNIMRSKRGEKVTAKPTVELKNVEPVTQLSSTILEPNEIPGTVVDETFYPEGFMLKIPIPFQTVVNNRLQVVSEGIPRQVFASELIAENGPPITEGAVYQTDLIYIPSANLRKCWRHDTGKLGLSEIGVLVNNMVLHGHRIILRPQDVVNYTLYLNAISEYYRRIANMMSTKRGDINTYGMAVRYPYSAKAYATLTNAVPKNTVEIHREMAKGLRVSNGDVVLVERFPCLGFMSVRPQKVHITDDPLCRYSIRVSGNSLVSTGCDHDGDTIYLASFHTPGAKNLLRKEWRNPNKSCYDVIQLLNKKAGVPHIKYMNLRDYDIHPFACLNNETHAELVKRATGVKSHTGPVIALAYNIMRIIENSNVANDQKTAVAVEVFLDRAGNSVFKQKHGVKSLHDIVIDAICSGDISALVDNGFKRSTSTIICNTIAEKAKQLGVHDLRSYHEWAKKNGASSIVNRIVREQNKIYFASRANLETCSLLYHLEQPAVDVPSRMLEWVTSGAANSIVTPLDKHVQDKSLSELHTAKYKDAAKTLQDFIDTALIKTIKPSSMRKEKATACLRAIFAFRKIRRRGIY